MVRYMEDFGGQGAVEACLHDCLMFLISLFLMFNNVKLEYSDMCPPKPKTEQIKKPQDGIHSRLEQAEERNGHLKGRMMGSHQAQHL